MADKKNLDPIDYMRISIEVMKNSVQEERAEGEVSPSRRLMAKESNTLWIMV